MPLSLKATAKTGRTLNATVQRTSDSKYWNPTATAWQTSPAFADKKIALTEGSGENLGTYSANISGLDGAGETVIRIHDAGLSDLSIGEGLSEIDASGNEITSSADDIADAVLSRDASNVEATAGADTLCALILGSFHSERSDDGLTWTIYATDDSTLFKTKTLAIRSALVPIKQVSG